MTEKSNKKRANIIAAMIFAVGMLMTVLIAGAASGNPVSAFNLVDSGDTTANKPTTTYYQVTSHNLLWILSAIYDTSFGVLFRPGSSMVGKKINEISFLVSKVGNPPGFVRAGCINGLNEMVYEMGGISAPDRITSAPLWATFRNQTGFTITEGIRCGVQYNAGDTNNYVVVYSANTNVFNGDLSYRNRWDPDACTPTTLSACWLGNGIEDFTAVMGFTPWSDGGGGGTDTINPKIFITSPVPNAIVRNPIAISGTVSDAGGIAKVEVRGVFYNPTTLTNEFGAWKAATVSGGSYTASLTVDKLTYITARATDKAGNLAWATVGVVFSTTPPPPGDTTLPVVTITAPANGATIASATIQVAGTATDNVGISTLMWKLDAGNFTPLSVGGTFAFAINDVQIGSHSVTVQATDAAGNKGIKTVTFTTQSNIPTCDADHHLEGSVCVPNDIPEESIVEPAWVIAGGGILTTILAAVGRQQSL